MYNQALKTNMSQQILVAMSMYIGQEALSILQNVIEDQFVRVNMEEITTLPATVQKSTDEQNEYVVKLFLLKKKELREGTKTAYLNAVKRLLTMIDKPLTEIEDIDVSYYLRWYETHNEREGGKRNNPVTVNNERRFLSAFFGWMRREKLIADNPVDGTMPKKVTRKPIDYFRVEELEQLREGCNTLRNRAIIEVLRSTGARIGELVPANISDIDWRTGDMDIDGEKGSGYGVVYLDEQARYHLQKYLETRMDDNPALFVSSRKPYGRLSAAGIRGMMHDVRERMGMLCRVYPHKLRKTLGMDMKNKGADIGVIQEVLRHKDPATTARYYAESTAETLRSFRKRSA
ncbi:tyrosine-type recombinase/integrase [Lachnospiraceae bacterium ASD3451]|uniref:tyrosine-type recombinase/integrase n=1 Tax=Diplocloster agilis TaxID=2850323 RepID=UPI001D43D496|nr:tyrosine-type recombinase/integrase [Diplocloster agilis]MBU9746571.1 tyrosine-type recombinase/integrase [Diplocloster agilis]